MAAKAIEESARKRARRSFSSSPNCCPGLALALASDRLAEGLLFDLKAHDPFAIGEGAIAILAVSLLAGYLPAGRVMRVDPMTARRSE
jgi:ABC-type lipoprotein release transport system permease subunit